MKSTVYRRDKAGRHVGTPEGHDGAQSAGDSRSKPGRTERSLRSESAPVTARPAPEPSRQPRKPRTPREPRAPRVPSIAPFTAVRRVWAWLRLLIVSYVVTFVALGFFTAQSLAKVDAASSVPSADTSGTNWLLVGSDSREGLTLKEQHQLHTGPDTGSQRADVIIIVHFGGAGQTTLVSIPRDSYVHIPEYKAADGTTTAASKNKVNSAYAHGGAPLLRATIEENSGLHIDHFMEIGFAGIRNITDAVKGVQICVPHYYDDKNSGLHVKKGCQKMSGKTALAYVRMRYADPTGDIGRIQRQQQYMAAVVHKTVQPATLLNPLRLYYLARAGTDSVEVGRGDGLVDVARFAMAMKGLAGGSGQVRTVPISNPDGTSAVGSVVLWDKAKAAELFTSLGAK